MEDRRKVSVNFNLRMHLRTFFSSDTNFDMSGFLYTNTDMAKEY